MGADEQKGLTEVPLGTSNTQAQEIFDDGTAGKVSTAIRDMLSLSSSKNKTLKELEVDGKPAQIVLIAPSDFDDQDLIEHARNLAKMNAKPRADIPNAAENQKKREAAYREGKSAEELDAIYPDMSEAEHFDAYSRRENGAYTRRMAQGHVIGVKLDGRIVAVQAYDVLGETKEGRPVLELSKASTLPYEPYERKGLNKALKDYLMQTLKPDGKVPLWYGASVNPEHIRRLQKRGWHIEEMDADVEPVQIGYKHGKDYIDANMIPQGYKAMWFDPLEGNEEK